MQCVEFEDRLNRLLDHRLSPDEDVQLASHAGECEDCASILRAQRRLFAGLRTAPQPPVDFADRVVSQVHFTTHAQRSTWRRVRWMLLVATAAGLAGIMVMSIASRQQQQVVDQPDPPRAVAAEHRQRPKHGPGLAIATVKPTPSSAKPQSEEERQRIEAYRQYLEGLARQVGDSKEFDDVSETLTPSIRPIQSSFGLAIDTLRRTLPRSREARPTKINEGANLTAELPIVV